MQPKPPMPMRARESFKNRAFVERLGFALAGISIVVQRERSFRTQCGLAVLSLLVTVTFGVGAVWAALVALCVGLVLALEMMNAAIEYMIDLLHPDVAIEIKHAKDAAAGAVLIASCSTACVGLLMALAWLRLL